jgi:hypothetical protein
VVDREFGMGRDVSHSRSRVPAVGRGADEEVSAFLREAETAGAPGGRLIFALDATMSRQPTWDRACALQGEMFEAAGGGGKLAVQLVYFRGLGECRASRWSLDPARLRELMTAIDCRGGHTQIGRVLAHARKEARAGTVSALVFVGDAMEEAVDDLAATAGELGLLGTPCFMFQEGRDRAAERAFREVARLSRGAYARFDASAADALRNLLRAVAAFAASGRAALEGETSREARLLLAQLDGKGG